jgi:hypothetical protein
MSYKGNYDKVSSEQKPGEDIQTSTGPAPSGRGHNKYKGPGAGTNSPKKMGRVSGVKRASIKVLG